MIKLGKLSNGKDAFYDPEGWIYEDGEAEENWQSVPDDKNDYRYTHGNYLYREAVDLYFSVRNDCSDNETIDLIDLHLED